MDFDFGKDNGERKCLICINEPYQDVWSVLEHRYIICIIVSLSSDVDFCMAYLFIILIGGTLAK